MYGQWKNEIYRNLFQPITVIKLLKCKTDVYDNIVSKIQCAFSHLK